MKPDMNKIDKAMRILNFYYAGIDDSAITTTLRVLQHVKEHGLALGEEEMLQVLDKIYCDERGLVGIDLQNRIAKAITDKQREI